MHKIFLTDEQLEELWQATRQRKKDLLIDHEGRESYSIKILKQLQGKLAPYLEPTSWQSYQEGR